MTRFALLMALGIGLGACSDTAPAQPFTTPDASLAKAAAATTCADADAVVRSLITLVRNATMARPATVRNALLQPLNDAHAALVGGPCDKAGAIAAMAKFNAAIVANAGSITAAQAIIFRAVSDRIVSMINLVP